MSKAHPVPDNIECPSCGHVIPISETIYHQAFEQAQRDLKAKSAKQEQELAEKEKQLQAREAAIEQRVQEHLQKSNCRP